MMDRAGHMDLFGDWTTSVLDEVSQVFSAFPEHHKALNRHAVVALEGLFAETTFEMGALEAFSTAPDDSVYFARSKAVAEQANATKANELLILKPTCESDLSSGRAAVDAAPALLDAEPSRKTLNPRRAPSRQSAAMTRRKKASQSQKKKRATRKQLLERAVEQVSIHSYLKALQAATKATQLDTSVLPATSSDYNQGVFDSWKDYVRGYAKIRYNIDFEL
ncbi:hypothetical protein FVE85_6187 [Porphyridium purpureum]|uniref:Uncharacterized protein n=1 Tax=Porphyridium purpureum TaxID=35688 RepID=A0A5J4Z681_PORPP|nr:hypothetical protein FVE85_6187 [Porphyridium purpureum]|eukprot:POR4375..scf295_1